MDIKRVDKNDIGFLRELIKYYAKNMNKGKLSNKDYQVIENSVVGRYAGQKKEIVNLRDFNKAFKDLGYIVSQ